MTRGTEEDEGEADRDDEDGPLDDPVGRIVDGLETTSVASV